MICLQAMHRFYFWIQRKANPHRCVVVHNGVIWFISSSLSTDDVCNMWTLNETQGYEKQLWHRAECVFASEFYDFVSFMAYLLCLASKIYKSKKKNQAI